MSRLIYAIRSFTAADDGAQVIEYALIIAVVSIGLLIALEGITRVGFSTFMARLDTCLLTSSCT